MARRGGVHQRDPGMEPITHTNFFDGVRYMEFTDAVTISMQTGERVTLPLG